jgi:protein-S-isoprenylcysteine O-methyltransferase Ste14
VSADYVLLALLWILYCVVHSTLISIRVTDYFKRVLGSNLRFYRLFFNMFSLITLIPLAMYLHSSRFQTAPVFVWSGYWRTLQLCLITLAAVLLVGGARRYSLRRFLGIQQISWGKDYERMAALVDFERSGVLGIIRHPWYAAAFILLWSVDLNAAEIITSIILSIYLVIGAILEERKLILKFGIDYQCYKEQVSRFIPLKWLMARRHG